MYLFYFFFFSLSVLSFLLLSLDGEFNASFSFSPTHVLIIVALVITHCANNLTILTSDQVGDGIFVVAVRVVGTAPLLFVSE